MGWFTKSKKLEDMTEKELLITISKQLAGMAIGIIMLLAMIFGVVMASS